MNRHWISDRARRDLAEIAFYIKLSNPEAARKTIAALLGRIELLRYVPGLGRERSDLEPGLRSLAMHSYVIFYKETGNDIEVVRVLNGARDLSSLF